jgi:type II secretion system protein G
MKNVIQILSITIILNLGFSAAEETKSNDRLVADTKAKTEATAQSLKKSLDSYRRTTGSYPTIKQGLRVLVDPPHKVAPDGPIPDRWRRILDELPNDTWGRPFSYTLKKEDGAVAYELRSFGEDGKKSNDDIVVTWKEKEAR